MGNKRYGKINYVSGKKWSGPPPPPSCSSSFITQLVPPILKTLILGMIGKDKPIVSIESLDPDCIDFTKKVAALSDASFNVSYRDGRRVQWLMTENRKDGSDLVSTLAIRIDDDEVFQGQLTIYSAFKRGIVTFTDCLFGAIELLYNHLLQSSYLGRTEIEMTIGVVTVRGSISHTEPLKALVEKVIEMSAVSRETAFDYTAVYGIFPDEKFGYFYGSLTQLVESPLPT